jgi:HlyD family secretion protein
LRKSTTAIAIFVLTGGAGAWWWQARSAAPLSYTSAVVKRGDIVVAISATGTLEPVEAVDVGAQVAGRISWAQRYTLASGGLGIKTTA